MDVAKPVLIVDSVGPRRFRMADAFQNIRKVYEFSYEGGKFRDSSGKQVIRDFALCLWHFGDVDNRYPDIKADKTIYYGGAGGNDTAVPQGAADRIWRRVEGSDGILSKQEAKELLEYAEGKRDKPPVLLDQDSAQLQSSLIVLCYGYLWVHAAAAEAAVRFAEPIDFSPTDYKEIFSAVGWFDLPDLLKKEYSSPAAGLQTHLSQVRSLDWWRQPFRQKQDQPIEEIIDGFAVRIKSEWARWHSGQEIERSVSQLVDAICQKGNGTVELPLVADAYCGLTAEEKGIGRK